MERLSRMRVHPAIFIVAEIWLAYGIFLLVTVSMRQESLFGIVTALWVLLPVILVAGWLHVRCHMAARRPLSRKLPGKIVFRLAAGLALAGVLVATAALWVAVGEGKICPYDASDPASRDQCALQAMPHEVPVAYALGLGILGTAVGCGMLLALARSGTRVAKARLRAGALRMDWARTRRLAPEQGEATTLLHHLETGPAPIEALKILAESLFWAALVFLLTTFLFFAFVLPAIQSAHSDDFVFLTDYRSLQNAFSEIQVGGMVSLVFVYPLLASLAGCHAWLSARLFDHRLAETFGQQVSASSSSLGMLVKGSFASALNWLVFAIATFGLLFFGVLVSSFVEECSYALHACHASTPAWPVFGTVVALVPTFWGLSLSMALAATEREMRRRRMSRRYGPRIASIRSLYAHGRLEAKDYEKAQHAIGPLAEGTVPSDSQRHSGRILTLWFFGALAGLLLLLMVFASFVDFGRGEFASELKRGLLVATVVAAAASLAILAILVLGGMGMVAAAQDASASAILQAEELEEGLIHKANKKPAPGRMNARQHTNS
jgi:hypothetical protein